MTALLEGVLVVSVEQAVAAPLASRYLADLGARVIKVERAEGDFARRYDSVVHGESAYFVWLNRGKESVALDIKHPDDAALLGRLLARADVFVQNLAPGAAARAGLDSDRLRARHPRLVTCDISGFAEGTPAAARRAYDLILQAETGLSSVTGIPEGYGRVGVSVVDFAGGMNAAIGILAALHARERSGAGSAIKISLFDAMADWMSVPLAYQEFRGETPARVGLAHPSIAPYEVYRTRDRGEVLIAVQNEREWRRLCERVVGQPALAAHPDFASNEARVRNRAAMNAILGEAIGALPRATLVERLDAAEIAWGAVNTPADLAAHPALRRMRVALAASAADLVAPPVAVAGAPPSAPRVPAAGEHTDRVRAEFAAGERRSEEPGW